MKTWVLLVLLGALAGCCAARTEPAAPTVRQGALGPTVMVLHDVVWSPGALAPVVLLAGQVQWGAGASTPVRLLAQVRPRDGAVVPHSIVAIGGRPCAVAVTGAFTAATWATDAADAAQVDASASWPTAPVLLLRRGQTLSAQAVRSLTATVLPSSSSRLLGDA